MSGTDIHQLKRFGRYLIMDHLTDGGMAKIFRARFLAEKADKIVAIKMVQPQYSKDKNFQEMFETELKLAFALHHPNICQTYDYGQYKGTWYTAMEYVDGKNLKQFHDRLKKRNEAFPIHLATFIISQVCQGLYYAHTFTDKLSGEHYKIIHRDISPHNIMITYDGAVKVIDFGIAKTDVKQDNTQAGTIKGKLSYLAPEYIENQELDQRYDMFAVGITFWEMLCGRKLFTASSDMGVIKQIQECKIPAPSSINPTIPKELDAIVLKALNKDRDLRYKDMYGFSKVLLKFLYRHFQDFNPIDLAEFGREIFAEEIRKDREKLLEFGRMDISPYIHDLMSETVVEKNTITALDPNTVEHLIAAKSNKVELQLDDGKLGGPGDSQGAQIKVATPMQQKRMQQMANQNIPPLPHLRGAASSSSSPSENGASSSNHPSQVAPVFSAALVHNVGKRDKDNTLTDHRGRSVGDRQSRSSRNRLNNEDDEGKKRSFGHYWALALSVVGAIYFYDPTFFGYLPKDYNMLSGSSRSSASETSKKKESGNSAAQRKAESGESGTLYFENFDPSMEIFVNNSKVDYSPLGTKVPLQTDISIVVKKRNSGAFETKLKLTAQNKTFNVIIPDFQRKGEGFLNVNRRYPAGSRLIYIYDGRKFEVELPVSNYRMPAGEHRIIIKDKSEGVIERMKFSIEPNKSHTLED
ncbi:MAG: serine/threonine-protein kinase [Bacteriovoracaceae bacterium]|nr:serine/threonine-protein kinase [Bacteriovoracaceae bacterium]